MFWDRTTLAAAGGGGEDGRSKDAAYINPSELRDLSDFSTNWLTLRPQMIAYLDRAEAPSDVTEITRWLVLLADRVCMYDDD